MWGHIDRGTVKTRGTASCPAGAPAGRTRFLLHIHVTPVLVRVSLGNVEIMMIVPIRHLSAQVGVTTINGAGNVMLFDEINPAANFKAKTLFWGTFY